MKQARWVLLSLVACACGAASDETEWTPVAGGSPGAGVNGGSAMGGSRGGATSAGGRGGSGTNSAGGRGGTAAGASGGRTTNAEGGIGGRAVNTAGGSGAGNANGGAHAGAGEASNVGGTQQPAAGRAGAGQSGGGAGGKAGGTIVPAACDEASDCQVPESEPPNCAQAVCALHRCFFVGRDDDGDGESTDAACVAKDPAVPVEIGGDCDDDNASVNSRALEICNEVDDDCDGLTDEKVGRADSTPPAPGATLACFDGVWYVTAWRQEARVGPPDPAPPGICTVNAIRMTDPNGVPDGVPGLPTTLFRIERTGTDAMGDAVKLELVLDVLEALPAGQRQRVVELFAGSAVLQLDLQLTTEVTWGFYIPAVGVPFRLD